MTDSHNVLSKKYLTKLLDPGEWDKGGRVIREPGRLSYIYLLIVDKRAFFCSREDAFSDLTILQYFVYTLINSIHNRLMDEEAEKHKT